MKKHISYNRGFTIVELLIVIVIIAILAAITIVAYNGVQARARASSLTSSLNQAKKKLELYKIDNNGYPLTGSLASAGLTNSSTAFYQYSSNGSTYCITASTSGTSYNATETSAPTSGACSGQVSGGIVTNLATNPHATSGWQNATPTGSTITYDATGANDGGSAYSVTTTQSAQMRIRFPHTIGTVANGDTVGISLDVYSPVTTTAVLELGIVTGSGNMYPNSGNLNVNAGWNRLSANIAINAASAGSVSSAQFTTVGAIPSGQTWKASRAMAVLGGYSGNYADGSSANWSWNGTANNSTSSGPPL